VLPQFIGREVGNVDAIDQDASVAGSRCRLDDIIATCKLAGIHDAIERMPDGYRARIGERGSGLSGGQRQRLAIARALLKRPQPRMFEAAPWSENDSGAPPAPCSSIARLAR
jgi:subfamily B ATP-binding cassette protein HlyB/CyaB